jgi:hypothetical protein
MAGHQRTADSPAGGGRADTPAGGGQGGAMLRMGMRARAIGEGRMRREPRRRGRKGASTTPLGPRPSEPKFPLLGNTVFIDAVPAPAFVVRAV